MKANLLTLLLLPVFCFGQSDVDKFIRGGELLLGGLSIFKVARSDDKKTNSKTAASVCVRNKCTQKITFRLTGRDADENEIKKELVIPKDGKECLFEVFKTIYTYEFLLATGETYKKGEYKIDDEVTFTLKDP